MDKIICVGKNYLAHAKELGDQVPEEPLFFLKPPSCIFRLGQYEKLELVKGQGEIHYELELVFKIRKDEDGVFLCGWTIGLDLTLRDLQTKLKKMGHPWERAKAFPRSAVTGEFLHLPEEENEYLNENFELKINYQVRQKGQGSQMRWSPNELLKQAQNIFEIKDGDLLFTGTPEGVGPLHPGDQLTLKLGNRLEHHLTIV